MMVQKFLLAWHSTLFEPPQKAVNRIEGFQGDGVVMVCVFHHHELLGIVGLPE